ncbi:cytochrome-c peroxidase [Pseudoflavitalea sp. X16]|uniref:cytochrome-c peroxidase n=1 Tax=Paraflavitalea devenefica TaxID=2716334 RepID=UPI00141E3256|nr:cytochrome c peroxidase [Paraflavitalea devenefica]NII23870.1 cytochrome-c peroxidase [Paraflavitalea devenefica]
MTIRWTIRIVLFLILGTVCVHACKKSDHGGGAPTPLSFVIPSGFPDPAYTFATNPLTEQGFQLGRKLFYDGRLSRDGNFPCASCHQQFAAFATFDHNFSHGFNNQFTTRNAPPLFNVVWQKQTHWDGGILNLEVQPLAPLTAPNEMAEDINNVINKLSQDAGYKQLFKAAYGDETINSQRMLLALTQFVGSLVSADSKYDRVKKGMASFAQDEQMGYTIFQSKCTGCHAEPLFTDNSFRNTGLAADPTINDKGRMRITNNKADSLKFKVPSLRNLYVTFPYGHDGRFSSVNQALEHYNSGVQVSTTVDPLVKNGIPLSTNDKIYLQAFLRTLTDSTFIKNPRFAAPE